ncbi:MAG: ABC transporter substrate-binding protein [Burkholderiales bacterium]|nr:ABC transporter substrate-binding protein [Burkholderiales bacterium]
MTDSTTPRRTPGTNPPRRRFGQRLLGGAGALAAGLSARVAIAQKKYGPGASDTEIRIGQTMPYSGPLSMLGVLGRSANAYFEKLNADGGINGRRVKLLSLDDGYNPAKTVEQTRRLVENDEVLLIFQTIGTPTNTAIHRYLNTRKVPQLLIMSGANKWNDPRSNPWTLSGMASYNTEARLYTRHMLATVAEPRIAVLAQNDDFGRDYMSGLREILGERARTLIVAEASYEVTDPTIDSQVLQLKTSGANVFMNFANGKFTSQAIRRAGELGWKPQMYLPVGASSIAAILQPAGVERAIGAITLANQKNPMDPQWRDDAGMKDYFEFMKRWAPGLDANDSLNVSGYSSAMIMADILKRCGDDLTRENVMRQALAMNEFSTPVMLPGVGLSTSPTDHEIYGALRLQRFDGKSWVPFGNAMKR